MTDNGDCTVCGKSDSKSTYHNKESGFHHIYTGRGLGFFMGWLCDACLKAANFGHNIGYKIGFEIAQKEFQSESDIEFETNITKEADRIVEKDSD